MPAGFGAVLLGTHTEKRGVRALWARVRCGGCGQQFTGNVRTCPNWRDQPSCPKCWARLNRLRVQVGLQPWDTPADAYPPEEPPPAPWSPFRMPVRGSDITPELRSDRIEVV